MQLEVKCSECKQASRLVAGEIVLEQESTTSGTYHFTCNHCKAQCSKHADVLGVRVLLIAGVVPVLREDPIECDPSALRDLLALRDILEHPNAVELLTK